MSYDAQFFVRCDHVVNNEYFGTRQANTLQRVVPEGTMLYNFDGQWTQELPVSNPMTKYVPIINIPSGTTQYYYNDSWNNMLPMGSALDNQTYKFVLTTNNSGTFQYYYFNETKGSLMWNTDLPQQDNTIYVPVLTNSQTVGQYLYNGIWANEFPNLQATTVYVISMDLGGGNMVYHYNNTWTPVPPAKMSNVIMRATPIGSYEYYYNNQWNTIPLVSEDGTIFIYIELLADGTTRYTYNNSTTMHAPTDFQVIQTRTLLYQKLSYYLDATIQSTPPSALYSPIIIQEQDSIQGPTYFYDNAWKQETPTFDNLTFVVENTQANVYYYSNSWNNQRPLILDPGIEVDAVLQADGTLQFYYNGQLNPYPPTEVLIVKERVLQQPINQYYYNASWNDKPILAPGSDIVYIPTKIMPQNKVQYYYNGVWNDVPQHIFDASQCPKCYGKGYYLDISFDQAGQTTLATGDLKLQQEILKILVQDRGENVFHPKWGNYINERLIGHKNTSYVQTKLRMLIIQTLQYLQQVQLDNQNTWKNMLPSEIIDTIDYVTVTGPTPDGYIVQFGVTSLAGISTSHQIQF